MWKVKLNFISGAILFLLLLQYCDARANLTCSRDSDCPTHATCQGGHCFCTTGYIDYIQETLKCLKEATKYREECEEDIQCNGLLGLRSLCARQSSSDPRGRCLCTQGSHYKFGICHKNSFIGDKCIVSDDCIIHSSETRAYCSEGKCICSPKHIPSQDLKNCIPVAGLGERCETNTTCIVPESRCEVYCQCRMGFVASKDSKHCLKAADTLNDACSEDGQCTEFLKLSRCDVGAGVCACQNFTHRLKNQCWFSVDLLGLCEYDSECYVSGDRAGVLCKDGACSCQTGYEMAGTACVKISQAQFGPGSASSRNSLHMCILPILMFSLIKIPLY